MKRLSVFLLLLPTATLALPGDPSNAGLLHLFSEPDHLVMIAFGVLVAAVLADRRRAHR